MTVLTQKEEVRLIQIKKCLRNSVNQRMLDVELVGLDRPGGFSDGRVEPEGSMLF